MNLGTIAATAVIGLIAYKTVSSKAVKRYLIGLAITKGADVLKHKFAK